MNQFLKTLLFFFITSMAFAQPSEQQKLEQRKEQILNEIAEKKARLESEKKKEKSVLKQIDQQKGLIALRQKLLNTTAKQTRMLSDNIYLTQLEMNKLNRELSVLKEDYEKMIVKSYKSRNEQSRVMFVLSSQNFLQAYKRIQYMKQYADFRKMQGEEIRTKKQKLEQERQKLEEEKLRQAEESRRQAVVANAKLEQQFPPYTEGIVVVGKTFFHGSPDPATARGAFLVSGDYCVITKVSNGFGYTDFFNSNNGKTTSGWINLHDLEPMYGD